MSTCPGGDLSVYGWGENSAEKMLKTCRPLGVRREEIEESVLVGWKESESVGYWGHGVVMPTFTDPHKHFT